MSERYTAGIKISLKKFIAVALLVSSALAWFLLINNYFYDIFKFGLGVTGFWADVGLMLFYSFGAFSALLGSSFSQKIGRRNLLSAWILFGVLVLGSILFFQGVVFSLFLSVLLGVSVGFGFPSVTAFLSDSTVSEERGRVSGLIVLITFILIFMGIAIISFLGSGFLGIILFCVILRSIGFFSLILDRCERKIVKDNSWRSVVAQRNFGLYLLPWILFNLAAGLLSMSDISTQLQIATARAIGISISYVFMAFSGVIAGLFADRIGRKQPIVIALVAIGSSFALLGYVQIPGTVMIYYSVYGIAWGILFALYLTVIGDLSHSLSKEKFYSLGIMVPLIIFTSSSLIPTFLNMAKVSTGLISPILSVIIFVSIYPVLRASETLPTSKINARKMKEHLNKIGKLIKESKE